MHGIFVGISILENSFIKFCFVLKGGGRFRLYFEKDPRGECFFPSGNLSRGDARRSFLELMVIIEGYLRSLYTAYTHDRVDPYL